MSEVTSVTVLKIKRLYRKLAKQLHPDINPKTGEIPELMELWNMITTAYNTNSLNDMEEAELLVSQALERIGMGCMEIEIPNLEEKIEAVEADIQKIRETDPYQYKYLLDDSEAVEERKRELKAKFDEYSEYEKQLDAVIDHILNSGVKIIWKMN
jgi:DNA repair exonuclease SbcCD ATPase subunit